MIQQEFISVESFTGEKFRGVAGELQELLTAAGVEFIEIEGVKHYPEMQVDQALGMIFRTHLTLAVKAGRN